MALNELLYSRLVQKYGKENVQIVRAGIPYRPNWLTDPITGRLHREFDNDGEAYRINCFAGETEVVTVNGDRPIKSLVGKATLLIPNSAGTGLWKEVEIKEFGKQKLLRLHLRRGTTKKMIRVTPDHRWLVRKKAIVTLTRDLKKGDRLLECFARKLDSYGDKSPKLSPIGVAHGFVFGDGSRQKGRANPASVTFCNIKKDKALVKYFATCQKEYFKVNGRKTLVVKGLPRYWKDLPPDGESLSYLYGWLAGYFAADGHVDKKGRTAILYSVSRKNLEYAKSILYRLGVRVSPIRTFKRQGYGKSKTALHSLTFASKQLPLDFWLIESHKAGAKVGNKRSDCDMFNRWVVDRVEDLDEKEDTYCAVVPGIERFTLSDNLLTMNCPYCGDRKGRLYVNHYWMQWDEDVCRHVDDMIGCFNEKCFQKYPENRSKFFQTLFSGCNPSDVVMTISESGPVKVIEPSPPGKIIRLTDLNPSQPACYYLRNRKYDVEWLDKYWAVGYVASVDRGHSPDCLNRLYIPMFYQQQLVGYQCRFIGDREWTADCPKVRTMPHMKRGKYLYNLDTACRSRVMVLVEGPTSNWAVGFRGTGLWGNSISAQQVNLVNTYWGDDCLIVVMLDGSAMKESAKVTIKLQANCQAKVISTQLRVSDDPGSLGEANSWQIIEETCKRNGVNLHDYLRGENASVAAVE